MKSRIAKSLTIAALAATLAACSSVPLDDKAGQGGGTQGSTTGQILDPFNPQSILAQQRSVYFDFDSYGVSDQYRGLVETHARYLASHPQQHIKIEGNTDARGGAEYNLALGQRRADAVRRMMTLLGVADAQIETISFGKEKPKALGTTEADYAENRRADIVYQR
ncbi:MULTISPECIES: peptidoglycan-associated lipoprotein Pal [Bordetella]|uniref:Peptidoglycan-associated lipoprotein n=3 Tax=Bordetella TaxID=517 RepID=A0A158M2D4_9BORD|nr:MULTISPECIES: peptidoglycan-associated lipoprotein Pal [Bordetella]AHV93511.1 peptidoglycan-associated lipoprotein [Bordetella holmesii ATCC 51541]AIT26765.1 peptidoglycan-associated lipoprotein [Bordetella holmesii 44057]EWM43860.1 peptidoglycan-associated lipoprotein [Bordetella holmesii 41130]EWM47355.1 peptidoglycan-associated lipoprotein [Bordetella holmesii 35009]EWM51514.1 peptidoglycan-associated lipoprotein [Bordetella holmesii 70147]